MLIRKLKRGDCVVVGGIVLQVRKAGENNLSLAIAAPEGTEIHHAREGEETGLIERAIKAPAR